MELKEKIRAIVSCANILNEKEIELIVEKTIVKRFKKNEILLREGQIPTKCYMVVEGCVREYLIKDGVEKSTAFFTEGDTFTPFAHDGKGSPSKHYWECGEDCVLTISDQAFEKELRASLPRLDAVFQQIAVEKLNIAKAEWSLFISSSPEERYLNLLETRPTLFNRVPNHQIASYLGMQPQSLSRIRKRIFNNYSTSLN
ncbi:Crp/Fnr family transcriptional regulator [Polaribacter sp. Hel1_85]|uniref:Crp/Fnr family transcriptional regulator n=1 Tax=Polaribacter sp. Hel1_85 TaxID=1250005 RepID=UPI00052DEE82|nr:Crp/Fnr family transcriptional regulator [Polaribacter sp. Hel1_85]KGL61717.1 cAMP-binding protein [Polaribacter sp. Hel1_85]